MNKAVDRNLEMTSFENELTAAWRPTAVRTTGRPRLRQEGDVRVDLEKIKIQNWAKKATDIETWKRTVQQDKTHKELQGQEKKKKG